MNIMSKIMPDINITRRSGGTLYSTLRKLRTLYLFCKELKLSNSVGIQPVFSPWEGWDEVIDISGDDDHDDANDPDLGEECGCHRGTEPGWRHETVTGQWTGFCGTRRDPVSYLGASSWSEADSAFFAQIQTDIDTLPCFTPRLAQRGNNRSSVTGWRRTLVALHWNINLDSYL